MTAPDFTHLDESGRARMVDVGAKDETRRTATARGRVLMKPETLQLIRSGGMKKGDVLAVAQVAGVMGAKRTPDLIPLCHPLLIDGVDLDFRLDDSLPGLEITATVRVSGRTGVEIEALTAVSVAALTVYDMCKAVDREMVIDQIRLVHKAGGQSGEFRRPSSVTPSPPPVILSPPRVIPSVGSGQALSESEGSRSPSGASDCDLPPAETVNPTDSSTP